MRSRDITGERFGRLIVVGIDGNADNRHEKHWLCRCDCGNEKTVTTGHLTHGTVTSCGCLRKEQAMERIKQMQVDNVRHGEAGTPLYNVWHSMIQRCKNLNNPVFRWYGGKGITVCDEWKDYAAFSEWAHNNGYEDKEDVPRSGRMSIDRIDSDKGYYPENCRWITVHENSKRAAESRWKKTIRAAGIGRTKGTVCMDGV